MAFIVDENTGNITCIQGDSGEYSVENVPCDKNYTIYFGIYNEKRKPIGYELSIPITAQETTGEEIPTTNVIFAIPASLTDYCTVKTNEEYATYYFGIKLCYDTEDYEDTLLLGNSQIGDLNTITVYPKKLEGTIDG